jgi:hypothetical protein
MASISITSIVKHPHPNNLEPKALSKQKNKEERFFTNGCSILPPSKEKEMGFLCPISFSFITGGGLC